MEFNFMDETFNIKFMSSTYADMFERLYIGAYTDEDFWGDVTINIPQYSLDEDEIFCSNDSPELIKEMIKQGYLEFLYVLPVNMGTYQVCKVTEKLKANLIEMQ